MTRARRLAALLAMVAALLGGAPPPVSGAAPNTLAGGAVSPVTGTTATIFSFAVEYASTAGWGATAVTAEVGGLQVPMSLIAGTRTLGSWAAASTLPAGTWQVVFRATAEQGPSPVLEGPVLTVTAPVPAPQATATATGNAGGNGGGNGGENGLGGGDGASNAPAAEVEPRTDEAPPPEPDPVLATPAPVPPAAPVAPAPVNPPAQAPAPVAPAPAGDAVHDVSPSPIPEAAAPATLTATYGPSGGGVIGTTTLDLGQDLLMNVLLIGLLGVAAVALVGSAILLLGRRRRKKDEERARDAEAVAVPIIEQRALRRARVRLEEEPMLPALGLDPSHQAPREIAPAQPVGPGSARRRQKGRR